MHTSFAPDAEWFSKEYSASRKTSFNHISKGLLKHDSLVEHLREEKCSWAQLVTGNNLIANTYKQLIGRKKRNQHFAIMANYGLNTGKLLSFYN